MNQQEGKYIHHTRVPDKKYTTQKWLYLGSVNYSVRCTAIYSNIYLPYVIAYCVSIYFAPFIFDISSTIYVSVACVASYSQKPWRGEKRQNFGE